MFFCVGAIIYFEISFFFVVLDYFVFVIVKLWEIGFEVAIDVLDWVCLIFWDLWGIDIEILFYFGFFIDM